MATFMASRGVFAARSVAPARCFTAARTPVAVVASPLRTSQSAFLGGSFAGETLVRAPTSRGGLLVMANNKKSIACTKEGTNRKRRRTSGFRARMATANGRQVLARRRARGRHSLAPASERKSGGKK